MTLQAISAVCSHCQTPFSGTPTRTFLGFQRVKCSSCGTSLTYPLTSGYRIAYWVFLVLFGAALANALAEGEVALPGLAVIGAVIALVRDAQIRRKVAGNAVSSAVDLSRASTQATSAEPQTRRPTSKPTPAASSARQMIMLVAGIGAFFGASYGVRALWTSYQENSAMNSTPYLRSMARALKANGGYGRFISVMKGVDPNQAEQFGQSEVQRGLMLLGPNDQAKRVEVLDHFMASATAADCAVFARGGASSTVMQDLIASLDSATLDEFTGVVADALVAADINPTYRPPQPDQEELKQFFVNVVRMTPDRDQGLLIYAVANMRTVPDSEVCWAARRIYSYALGQQGEARASAIRTITLLASQSP